MFSFAGDVVLDPFAGSGSTGIGAIAAGRNSVGLEIEPAYVKIAAHNIANALKQARMFGAIDAELIVEHRSKVAEAST
jgi:modification methylase